MDLASNLRARKGNWTGNRHLAPLDGAFENAMTFIGAASAKRRALEAEGNLSPKGISEAVREFVDGGMAPELRRVRERMHQVQAELAARREALAKPKIDQADEAAARIRAEARAFLRSASTGDRAKVLLGRDADPTMLAAVLEAPEALSGVTGQLRQDVVARHLEVNHAGDIREMEAADEGLAVLRTAVKAAEDDIRAAAGAVAA